jgi:hypothetical protein
LGGKSIGIAPMAPIAPLLDHKGRPISWNSAIVKLFSGFAFIAVAIALAVSGNGRGGWFWMLIPGFGSLGYGISQWIQLRKVEKGLPVYSPNIGQGSLGGSKQSALPPTQTTYVEPESRYKTGDLVPPSVTDNTTRHLEPNREGETMTLPKRQ